MDKIIGMGNALVDVLVTIEDNGLLERLQLPEGSMQLIDDKRFESISNQLRMMKVHRSAGGSASNFVRALAGLGVQPGYIGKTGTDETGTFFEKALLKAGVQVKLLKGDLPSGVASAFISQGGERTFATYLGAAVTLDAAELSADMFAGYSYLFIEGFLVQNHELIEGAMQMAKEAGLQVCLDLGSYNVVSEDRDFFEQLMTRYVDIVFANEVEAKAFTGLEPSEALEAIASKCSIAIVKLGEKGSLIKKGTQTIQVEPVTVRKVVDTTGAGDYYAAGFLYGLTCGLGLEKCAQISSLLSAAVIQTMGTTLPKRKWNEIKLKIEALLQD